MSTLKGIPMIDLVIKDCLNPTFSMVCLGEYYVFGSLSLKN